ncbi:DUF3147 family protein [Granulicella sp. L46]|uniref:DUF3147 family protein n=1 Tax=Granulicella sp. L46 TaxID=1641865 RepID=UPI001C2057BC|nr:DUF3147 family protein [Granulicella sp. L46]
MIDLMVRFVIGGVVVSVFAVLGDLLKPESFGGVFAAAPTIALATLVLTMHKHGAGYVAVEGRSMLAGAIAFFVYASVVSFVLMRYRTKTMATTIWLLTVWFGTAAGLWAVWLRR